MIIERCHWRIDQEEDSWPTNVDSSPAPVPVMMRRRLSPMGRKVVENLLTTHEFLKGQEIPWVISCRHGDSARMGALLLELADGAPLSPTDFSLSVHNAIGAMFSIATGNKQVQTALAAGKASFELGLLEAYALQKEQGGRVGYIYYDAPLPPPFEEGRDSTEICISLILGESDSIKPQDRDEIKISFEGRQEEKILTSNPITSLTRFLKSHDRDNKISIPGGAFILERIC